MSVERETGRHTVVVLVAEDDAVIRMMTVDALKDAGFAVLEAAQAEDALTILTGQAAAVRALFTDIHMQSEMTGLELAHHVRAQWPWIAVLVASGNLQPSTEEMPGGSRFLSKPYHPDQVVRHVRELLETV